MHVDVVAGGAAPVVPAPSEPEAAVVGSKDVHEVGGLGAATRAAAASLGRGGGVLGGDGHKIGVRYRSCVDAVHDRQLVPSINQGFRRGVGALCPD